MKKKYEILPKIPQFLLFRKLNFPKILPLNLTVSVSYRCNSRCKTCNVWKKKTNEFSLEEFDKTFASLKKAPYWLVLSGGEPFLRHDLVDICSSAYHHIEPGIINIPTNGILYNTIPKKVEEILNNCPESQIIVNLSVDGIGEDHDLIRGIPGNFEKSMKTYDALSALDYPNFSLGIHTVISRFNVHKIPQIYNFFKEKHPDSYITEIAEERVELDTIGANISPTPEEYEESIDFLINAVTHQKYSRISRVTQAFRIEYYNHVKKMLKQHQQIIPCNAGIASAHIAPDGDVWTCCIRADPVGNLRDVDYDFKKIWFNDRARKQRASIKNKECCCPLANAHYTNMLCDLGTLMRVGSRYLMSNFNRR
jgi:MoaA/NifB/PqqE/SkfB family radical SAM enzyme